MKVYRAGRSDWRRGGLWRVVMFGLFVLALIVFLLLFLLLSLG